MDVEQFRDVIVPHEGVLVAEGGPYRGGLLLDESSLIGHCLVGVLVADRGEWWRLLTLQERMPLMRATRCFSRRHECWNTHISDL